MDICVVCFVLILWTVTQSVPLQADDLFPQLHETTTQMPMHVVQMGKGLERIPPGDSFVRSINFAYNHIAALPPYVFHHNQYKTLHRIELCQNKISEISQRAFRELKQLKMVDLSGNNITIIDPNTFKPNPRLEKLDLSYNKISFNPSRSFLQSHSLETLILSDNKIEQIYEVTFYKLPKLRNLMMDNNIIFLIEPNSFAPLGNLMYLSLVNTGVYRLSENMFPNQSYPRIIDLTDTPLANKFNPPLTKVKNNAVVNLINIDRYF
ncbi:SLIT and NTRK-like protein 6 [Anoplophora glabripennis]|uniref:SLIT and NTRK-like protein 6 n=1 Tax=Anoplophora glabripennis TaxID=217634 RepID=UPI000874ED25|nr:SLIT and NTRK-like protein 6 [Anoplophora glabripennis]